MARARTIWGGPIASTSARQLGIRSIGHDLGLNADRRDCRCVTLPHEILDRREQLAVDPGPLVHASRMAAKVSWLGLQDGYQMGEKKKGRRAPALLLTKLPVVCCRLPYLTNSISR